MKKRNAIVAGAIGILVLGVIAWFATMPYPIKCWWDSYFNVRYSAEWPISEPDFDAVKRLVNEELGFREIIRSVTVTGPEEIKVEALRWRKHQSEAFSVFIVKKINGKWVIAERSSRASLWESFGPGPDGS